MVRSKVKLEYIQDASARRASFKKRSAGLLKKVKEISTLCDLEACVIMFGQYHDEPIVWPSPLETQQIIKRFRRTPMYQQLNKMMDLESFTTEKIREMEEKLLKMQKENHCKEMILLVDGFKNREETSVFGLATLGEIELFLEEKIKEVKFEMEAKEKGLQIMKSKRRKEGRSHYHGKVIHRIQKGDLPEDVESIISEADERYLHNMEKGFKIRRYLPDDVGLQSRVMTEENNTKMEIASKMSRNQLQNCEGIIRSSMSLPTFAYDTKLMIDLESPINTQQNCKGFIDPWMTHTQHDYNHPGYMGPQMPHFQPSSSTEKKIASKRPMALMQDDQGFMVSLFLCPYSSFGESTKMMPHWSSDLMRNFQGKPWHEISNPQQVLCSDLWMASKIPMDPVRTYKRKMGPLISHVHTNVDAEMKLNLGMSVNPVESFQGNGYSQQPNSHPTINADRRTSLAVVMNPVCNQSFYDFLLPHSEHASNEDESVMPSLSGSHSNDP